MKILAIETSCDETGIALLEASGNLKTGPRFKILKNLVASQIKTHRPYGGVVPNLAKREHLRNLPILFGKIAGISNFGFPVSNQFPTTQFQKLKKFFSSADLMAVTVGPGLEPALWTGINFVKEFYSAFKIHNDPAGDSPQAKTKLKIIGVNHLEGHLYSFLLEQKRVSPQKLFPAIALVVSGGHTILLLMKDLKNIKKLGETRDDAVGEAFDKVARLLNLPYAGGPEVEKLARRGNAEAVNFPRPMLDQKNYDFSFSGLKTAVLYYLRGQSTSDELAANKRIDEPAHSKIHKNSFFPDIAASFQKAAIDVLIKKTMRAAGEFGARSIIVSGGVAANKELGRRFREEVKKFKNLKVFIPEVRFCTDNAVIIGAAGYIEHLRKKQNRLVAQGNLNF